MSVTFSNVCGALGCSADADVVIAHPKHGERVVCGDCSDGHEVVRDA